MAISIQRFAPTRAGKFGLAVDLAVLAASMVMATHGPWTTRLGWTICALGVFWSTSSVAHHYAHNGHRAPWEEVLHTLIILLSVATVLALGGALVPFDAPDLRTMLAVALPIQVLLRMTVFGFVRARMRPPRQVLILGTGPLGRITGEDLGRRRAQCSYLSWPGESVPAPLQGRYLGEASELPAVLQREVLDEVYLCGLPHAQARSLQAAVGTCETFGVPFALPAYSVRLGRAQPVATKAVEDGYLHYVTGSREARVPGGEAAPRHRRFGGRAVGALPLPSDRRGAGEAHLAGAGLLPAGARRAARPEVPHAQVPLDGGQRRGAEGDARSRRTSRAGRSSR